MSTLISVVIPCFNEEETIPLFYSEMSKVMDSFAKLGVEQELIFVDDGSSDSTMEVLHDLADKDSRVKYLSFSRNFGKEAALYAGFQACRGDYVVNIDVDLQDRPDIMLEMYDFLIKNPEYDCVATRRVDRKGEPPIRSFFARMFYKIINKISDVEVVDGAKDYRMMTKKMMGAIMDLKEYNRFSKGLFVWVGFKTKWIELENKQRVAGETKWSFWKLFKYSIEGIVGFSTAPLSIASFLGVLFFFISVVWGLVIFIRALIYGDPVAGFPTLSCMILLIGGIQLLCLGIFGKYLANTYLETKKRPVYVLKESNIEEKK